MGKRETWAPGELTGINIAGRDAPQTRSYRRLLVITSLLCSSAYLLLTSRAATYSSATQHDIATPFDPLCSQVDAIVPFKHSSLLGKLDELYHTKDFQLNAYESLGGAVRIPSVIQFSSQKLFRLIGHLRRTESEDEEKSPTEDPVFWGKFKPLHEYLEKRFPLMYEPCLTNTVWMN